MVTSIKGNATSTFGGNVDVPQIVTDAPAFGAYKNTSSTQTLTGNVWAKIIFDEEEFDTNANYDHVTNYRFTPTVEGYYQLNAGVFFDGAADRVILRLYKNGNAIKNFQDMQATNSRFISGTVLVYANGTTDYFEIYGYNSATRTLSNTSNLIWFNGYLARAV